MALQNVGPQQFPRYWGPVPVWIPDSVARVATNPLCIRVFFATLSIMGVGLTVISAHNAYIDFSAHRFKRGMMDVSAVGGALVILAVSALLLAR